ncbi:hypothetical protein N7468_003293 [Penicillium chermesinum]|uniref:Protein-lysine N-methyltransferase EFM6 n=1 Tax=Penicillium chermesinum TaxID=63820 RepID=A0A9W9TT83_9EURO|nr:uncharacterized protein N7468_003293 [Penicillium chermesinum]KAJ5238674.1 hypothetical protein N7468_003293 [Penicillium chermesinum]
MATVSSLRPQWTDPPSPRSDIDVPFELTSSLAPPRELKAAGTTSLSFDGLLKDPLLLKEDLKEGCGGQLWPAGMILAEYLLRRHSSQLLNKSMYVCIHPSRKPLSLTTGSVELGAGGGLVGLAIARGCQISPPIHITDQEPMYSLMRENIQLNGLGSSVEASVLNWGEPIPDHIPRRPEVILAADCVYFEPAFPLLITTLQDLLGPDSVCYFCFKRRRRADLRFMKAAKKAFHVEEVQDDPNAHSYSRENIFLYRIRAKHT